MFYRLCVTFGYAMLAAFKKGLLENAFLLVIMPPPPSVTGEVYCFPRRQLIFIFRFGRRVIHHSKGL